MTTALADESSLTLPENAASSVELDLPHGLADLKPESILRIYTGKQEDCCEGKLPLSGRYSLQHQRLSFSPTFEFLHGQSYTVWHQERGSDTGFALTEFQLSDTGNELVPAVIGIFPSGPDIPENILRFHFRFSAPMQPHKALEFISLVNESGRADPAAFMSFQQELWNHDRTRLTLLLDPGRIKRGVAQNLELGPALVQGQRYTIIIREGWPAALGGERASAFKAHFTIGAPLRTIPDPSRWRIESPAPATTDPLVVTFDRPMNNVRLRSALSLRYGDGVLIAGHVLLDDDGRQWQFMPQAPWGNREIELHIDPFLEDVAGNNLLELLDHELIEEGMADMRGNTTGGNASPLVRKVVLDE